MSNIDLISNCSHFQKTQLEKEFSENPLGFVDIGARGGVHSILAPFAKYSSVLAFEPDKAECENIKSQDNSMWKKFSILPKALHKTKSVQKLNIVNESNNSSLLKPNPVLVDRYKMDKWKIVGECSLEVDSLDNIEANGEFVNSCDIIKIDTQGSEYEILEGAKNILQNKTVAVIAEVSLCEIYSGQKLFSDIEFMLRKHGFVFYGFSAQHYRSTKKLDKKHHIGKERLFYADAVFFKDPFENLDVKLTTWQSKTLFISTLLTGYYDFALEINEKILSAFYDFNQIKLLEEMVLSLAYKDPKNTIIEVENLAQSIKQFPEISNLLVGEFVDSRRGNCNYDDILGVSPLPKKL